MKQCPRCASELTAKDKVCPRCGLPVENAGEAEEELAKEMIEESKSFNLNRAQKAEKRKLARKARKEAKRQKRLAESVSNTEFSKFANNADSNAESDVNEILSKKRKKSKKDSFSFEVDDNGEINIDTKDVEIIGEETLKVLEEKRQQTYSVKKARGDYRPPKIKWWEIYKLADRAFARKKIKKEVSKASKVKPSFISKTKLLLFAIFFGWFGCHNFYAKNKKKGFVSLFCLIVSVGSLMIFGNNEGISEALRSTLELWLVGCFGFIVMIIWISDIVNIIFNKFNYRIQREKFISEMNIETRAKLGEKYIDLELLKKPWYVRFKVWCDKKKRNYQEWKHDRRQAMIEREKAKLEKQEEKNKIENEIAEFEQKENDKIKEQKKAKEQSEIIDEKSAENSENTEKHYNKPKKAKISVKTNNKNKSKKK